MKTLESFVSRIDEILPREVGRRAARRFSLGKALPLVMLVLILVFTAMAGVYWYRGVHSVTDTHVQSFLIHHHATVAITNDRGNVSIRTGATNMVVVQSTRHEQGVVPDLQNLAVNAHAVADGDTIQINTTSRINPANVNAYGIDLTITMPVASDVSLTLRSGNILIDGINGSIQAKTASGTIGVQNIRGTGPIQLQAEGTVAVDRLSGVVNLSTADGHIEAVETTLYGQSSMSSINGDIDFDGNIETDCRCSFSSRGGSVNITLPSLASFDLHATTMYGLLENEFADDQTGIEPRAQLKVQTIDGDITINDPNK